MALDAGTMDASTTRSTIEFNDVFAHRRCSAKTFRSPCCSAASRNRLPASHEQTCPSGRSPRPSQPQGRSTRRTPQPAMSRSLTRRPCTRRRNRWSRSAPCWGCTYQKGPLVAGDERPVRDHRRVRDFPTTPPFVAPPTSRTSSRGRRRCPCQTSTLRPYHRPRTGDGRDRRKRFHTSRRGCRLRDVDRLRLGRPVNGQTRDRCRGGASAGVPPAVVIKMFRGGEIAPEPIAPFNAAPE